MYVSFQLNFVDYLNGGITTLFSGAGMIVYSASDSMTVESSEPSCVDWSFSTVERANSMTGPDGLVRGLCGKPGVGGVDRDEGVELGFQAFDPGQVFIHEVDG